MCVFGGKCALGFGLGALPVWRVTARNSSVMCIAGNIMGSFFVWSLPVIGIACNMFEVEENVSRGQKI